MEVHYKNNSAVNIVSECLIKHLNDNSAIVCIGTDKCIVDSLGPLVGTMLKKENLSLDIYGTLEEPVHAMNLTDYINIIKDKQYDNVIAIDACLSIDGRFKDGIVEVREGPIHPGKGIGKTLPEVGNISIIGIVSSDKPFRNLLEETSLSLVYGISDVIAKGIVTSISLREKKNKRCNKLNFVKRIWTIWLKK